MDQITWAQTAQHHIEQTLKHSDFDFSLINIPPETEEIGGGAGKSFCISKDNQQVAAITRFDSLRGEASPTILHLVREAGSFLDLTARIIAKQTNTPLAIQGLGT